MKHLTELRIDALQRLREELLVQSRVVTESYLKSNLTLSNTIFLLNKINSEISQIDEIFIDTDYSQAISDMSL